MSWDPRLTHPNEIGVGFSGVAEEVLGDGRPNRVLTVTNSQMRGQQCQGLPSIHVAVSDVTSVPTELRITGKLVLDVRWQSGIGGGEAKVDATQGTFFTMGGFNSLEIDARFEPILQTVDTADLVIFATKRVEATVHWLGSINPKPALCTEPGVTLESGVPSAFIRVPRQSYSMIAHVTDPASLPTLTADLSSNNLVLSRLAQIPNPFVNGAMIVHGTEFVRFTSAVVTEVFPIFELWL